VSRSVVVNAGLSRYVQNISVGPHLLQADEPGDAGGNDVGPNPYELLLAALGACTSMTVRMYAERKQWPLRSVRIATPRTGWLTGLTQKSPSWEIYRTTNGRS
jgi:uncharacterized OsmC-like protein